jgi:hypothetical protein
MAIEGADAVLPAADDDAFWSHSVVKGMNNPRITRNPCAARHARAVAAGLGCTQVPF